MKSFLIKLVICSGVIAAKVGHKTIETNAEIRSAGNIIYARNENGVMRRQIYII